MASSDILGLSAIDNADVALAILLECQRIGQTTTEKISGTQLGLLFDALGAAAAAQAAAIAASQPLEGTVGGANSLRRLLVKKTGIADNVATSVITVTVPNGNQSANIKLRLMPATGSTDAFESSRIAEADVLIARTPGVDTVKTDIALGVAGIATVAAGATLTLAYATTAVAGAIGATQTFDIQVTLNDSGNVGGNQIMVLAELMNSEANGVTMAAA